VEHQNGFRAELRILKTPDAVHLGQTGSWTVRVKNVGRESWPARGPQAVALSYHWQPRGHQNYFVFEGERTTLPRDLRPGEEVVLSCRIAAPNTAIPFILEFDLVRGPAGWFEGNGPTTTRAACKVIGRHARDNSGEYDYQTAYQQVDLESDYWTIVGPRTRSEFEALGQGKRRLLIDHGLTPDARVLDVGCGTGQLSGPLFDYLSPKGLYYGTDIAREAVAFCQKKYPRPNFVFVQNEMSRIPVEGVQFDFIYLGSVFTHMYPEEIRDMLIDFRRLLAAGGKIIADVFVTSKVARYVGSRAMVEINEAYLLEMFRATGLRYQRLMTWDWSEGAQRWILLFTHGSGTPTQAA
jgi:ubiquinone/menaquinone biosynthesis C-methylase UbiE